MDLEAWYPDRVRPQQPRAVRPRPTSNISVHTKSAHNGLAASNRAVYPVWTDGRNDAIATTGIGETDIFTNVEIRP